MNMTARVRVGRRNRRASPERVGRFLAKSQGPPVGRLRRPVSVVVDIGAKEEPGKEEDASEHICDTRAAAPKLGREENNNNNKHHYLLNSHSDTNCCKLSSIGNNSPRTNIISYYCCFILVVIITLSACSSGESLVINVASRGAAGAAGRPALARVHIKRSTGEVSSARLQEIDALAYLQRYGYMNGSGSLTSSDNLITEDSFQEAVMDFQRFAGIPETGSVDSTTLRYMQMPRCGNKDRSGKGENGRRRRRRKRRKRYALQGSKWRRQELTYRISQYPTRFLSKKHEVDGQIEKAFKIWSQVAPIDFVVKKEGRVHIDIRFASGEHGDGDPFDGPGNTLAHAYFPQYGGDAHFDDQEYWTVDSYTGTNIFQVAAHELGHSLGLGHSSVREALMAPFYQKYKPNFKLHADDILGIQALYGEKGPSDGDDSVADSSSASSTSTTSTTTSTTETPPARRRTFFGGADADTPDRDRDKAADLCQEASIDAITRTEDGNTYVFRGQHYWQVKNEGLANGGAPGKISRDWDGLPGDLDAALTWSDGKTFFFKGDRYWRFQNKRREPGYPKLISAGFAGIPNNLDAAFVWGGNGKTYFFKRDKYWRYDSKQEPPVSGLYPKPLKNWSGLPAQGIQAAFQWENGMSYFFKDDLYYRFDDREFEVDRLAKPAFPRSTAEWWFGCTNSNLPLRAKSGEPGSASDLDAQSSLLFHRKPNLLYSSLANSNSSPKSNSNANSNESPTQLRSATDRASSSSGASAISNFLSSLGSLWGSSSGGRAASAADGQSSDWSFHRGIGEEVHKILKRGPADSTRWNFPVSSSSSSPSSGGNRGEQSRSELRMEPNSSSGSNNNNDNNNYNNDNH